MIIRKALERNPIVAILRGIEPREVEGIVSVLFQNGVRLIEVPLNHASARESLEVLVSASPEGVFAGAGTVTSVAQLDWVAELGVDFALSPVFEPNVVARANEHRLEFIPGVFSPSEVFSALQVGCDMVKLFPYQLQGPSFVSAMRSVLPGDVGLIGVGGFAVSDLRSALASGLDGIGVGSSLFRPGLTPESLARQFEESAGYP